MHDLGIVLGADATRKRNKKVAIKHGFADARERIVAGHGLRVCASASLLGGQGHFSSPRALHSLVLWTGMPRNLFGTLPPRLGFKSFEAAQCTLAGVELMHMIKKRQWMRGAGDEGLTAAEQFYALASSSLLLPGIDVLLGPHGQNLRHLPSEWRPYRHRLASSTTNWRNFHRIETAEHCTQTRTHAASPVW